MTFQPNPHDALEISGDSYKFITHGTQSVDPIQIRGRLGTVFQLQKEEGGLFALKVFDLAYRSPYLERQALGIAPYAILPGLTAGRRFVITPANSPDLVKLHPELRYAELMPWMEGQTWQKIIEKRDCLSRGQSLLLAEKLLNILVRMEGKGLAHCSLCGSNVIVDLTSLSTDHGIEFIGLENLYVEGLNPPEMLPTSQDGYGARNSRRVLWSSDSDRFSGAILLSEMLGWCDERVCTAAAGSQYFAPNEIQKNCDRYQILIGVLREKWGDQPAALFEQTWRSDDLANCPNMSQWAKALGVSVEKDEIPVVIPEIRNETPIAQAPVVKGWRPIVAGQPISEKASDESSRISLDDSDAPVSNVPDDVLSVQIDDNQHPFRLPEDNSTLKNSSDRPINNPLIVLIIFVSIILCGIIIASLPTPKSSFDEPAPAAAEPTNPPPTSTPTEVPTPRPTRTPDYSSTTQARYVLQTQIAEDDPEEACWAGIPVANSSFRKDLCDSFDVEKKDWLWLTGTDEDEWGKGTRIIKNGSFFWEFEAKQGVAYRKSLDRAYSDFEIITQTEVESTNNETASSGVFFRESGRDFYTFQLDSSYYYVSRHENGDWTTLIEYTRAPNPRPGPNWLGVVAQGSHFDFYINGEKVNELDDNHLEKGSVGIIIDMNKDEKALLRFDDFAVLIPTTNGDAAPESTNDLQQPGKCEVKESARLYNMIISKFVPKFNNEQLIGTTFVFNSKPFTTGEWEMVYRGNVLGKGFSEETLPCYVKGDYLYCGALNIYTGGVPHVMIKPKGQNCSAYETEIGEFFLNSVLKPYREANK